MKKCGLCAYILKVSPNSNNYTPPYNKLPVFQEKKNRLLHLNYALPLVHILK